MSARGRIAVLLAAAFALTSNLVAHARASRPTQDSSAKNTPQASSTAAAALPPEIRGVLEDAHALLGEASAAAEIFARAVQLEPNLAEIRLHAAIVYLATGSAERAGRELAQALRLDPSFEARDDVRQLRARLTQAAPAR